MGAQNTVVHSSTHLKNAKQKRSQLEKDNAGKRTMLSLNPESAGGTMVMACGK